MYKVKRAIIMAAGKGERLAPVTLKTPKPLIRVNGVRMIETIIEGLRHHGITEIYVVVGYRKEQFAFLEESYPGLRLIENPYYEECNNISSLYVARNYIAGSMILDGDQMIYHRDVLSPEFERSGYNAVWTDAETPEWLLTVENGVITHCSRNGGRGGWQLFSISRWNPEDGQKLKEDLEREFEDRKNRQIYWDDVALFCYPERYELGIKKMRFGDVVEIDDLKQLAEVDPSYAEQVKQEDRIQQEGQTRQEDQMQQEDRAGKGWRA